MDQDTKTTSDYAVKDLRERDLIAQVTDVEALKNQLNKEQTTLYCGFDPTADSLHLGHLVPLLALKRFQQHGHRPIALVGGATGLIGDPSFKTAERTLNSSDLIAHWADKIKSQVEPFIDFNCGDNSAIIENNINWIQPLNVIEFLRNIGKHFSVNSMIKREAVQQRINRHDSGISFTEFSYTILQGLDFAELNKRYNCTLQIGGSDQWGNIVSGIDLCRKLNKNAAYGLTVPLITKSDGTKFGKTESGTIWLDPTKTSPYAFYQFWLKVADNDVYKFLKFFTFLSINEINAIEAEDASSNEKPKAQQVLAEKVTEIVHGIASVESAQRISKSLFANELSSLTKQDVQQLQLDGLPSATITTKDITDKPITQFLSELNIVKSGKQAKDMLTSNSVFINKQSCSIKDNMNLSLFFNKNNAMHETYFLIKTGKRNHFLVELVD
jgi:tyrosyl-tRNA synthetase